MIVSRRDTNGNPSMSGMVLSISVWAYEKGIINSQHFFGYEISKEKVYPFIWDFDGRWGRSNDVKLAYNEFLAKVNR